MFNFKREKVKKSWWGFLLLFLIAIIVIMVISWILNNEKEIRLSDENNIVENKALVCSVNENDKSFFNDKYSLSVGHIIKVTFSNDRVKKLFYSYTGEYESEKIASVIMSEMHASYNIYMNKNGVSQDSLVQTFSNIDTTGRIDIYGDMNSINGVTAVFFFLERDELEKVRTSSEGKIKELYEKKGFYCKY